jgi:hypothetical protein
MFYKMTLQWIVCSNKIARCKWIKKYSYSERFRNLEINGYRPGTYAPVEDRVINFVEWCVGEMRKGLS